MSCIEFTVNGVKCSVNETIPRETSLNAYLRYYLSLPGTKAMCHQGGCGACIVAVRAERPTTGTLETFSVNSCLVLVFSCHGWEITTIEGIGNRLCGYSEGQKRIAAFNGTQCGYCTPGWVMQIYSLQDKHLTMQQMEDSLGSNTCRCTGYRPILDTAKSFAVDASPDLCAKVKDIEDLCKKNIECKRKCSSISESDWCIVDKLKIKNESLISLNFGTSRFYKAFSEKEIFDVLSNSGDDSYMFVDGNTAKGVYKTYERPKIMIDISDVRSLKTYEFSQNLVLGGNISLEDCITIFTDTAKSMNGFAYLEEFVKHIKLVAHISVRKIGSIAGNLMLKHTRPDFQSDIFLLFETVGAYVTLRNSSNKKETLSMIEFLSSNMRGQLILNVELPPLGDGNIVRTYKILPRNQNALAIVNAGFLLEVNNHNVITEAKIVYGNISTDFIHAYHTEQYLLGKNIYCNDSLQGAIQTLSAEIIPEHHPPKPSPECRKKLAIGLFYKFILNISPAGLPCPKYRSGGTLIERPLSSGKQDFQTDKSLYPLNEPLQKLEALIQASGEAQYANDIPPTRREVFAAFVLSTVHGGEIEVIDASDVLKIEGVLAVYTASDIPGKNSFGFPGIQLQYEDEEILASRHIKFFGQPVAILVANSEALAVRAARKVKVTYKNVPKTHPVLTIDAAKSDPKRYRAGDSGMTPKSRGANVKEVVKGVYEIGAQYHYYIEPITCVVNPVDKGLEVYDSTQWMDLSQIAIAQCLGINESDVHLKVRRIGGGFGGKISRNVQVSTACALVAKKMDLPCRFILPIETNLTIAGRRLPCQCVYEVGVDDNGKIQYLDATIVEDDGCSHNENILSYTAEGFPNCYVTDTWKLKTGSVLTDLPSNTFARAPGTSEGIACIENIMEHISYKLQIDSTAVRLANMRTEDNDIPQLIEELKIESDYDKRVLEVEKFNKENRWMKRAIQTSVMLFPVQYYGNYTAMVSIYRGDGTVTVTTGGIEMGQGLNTKAAQVCAYELSIPVENVTVIPNYSFVAANNVFSGSSITSESVCFSIIKACKMLNSRLEPIRKRLTNPTWLQVVQAAGEEQIELSAKYMMTDKEPELQRYNAFSVVILEVQLDVLTGRHELLRADMLEDVGLSTNPTVDVGQLEGAYVQGLGYFLTEDFVYDKTTGKLLTNDALNYEVPLAKDIPVDFRIKFKYNAKNPKGVLGSKTVGEMGMCTAHGVTHALRKCIYESRKESGYDPKEWINIDHPYNTEAILKALDVKLNEFILTCNK
ncbi:indole-3-acetaldehyde oxidase [Papilio machaon]|uniref:indole-3-acetaldehyde oxidase n=1 Tax=Papilio machaon TaxID=76193 RepID=UPI001E663897|nr:indole-3-acetaldehyde oxidase [Papilio machaon]